MENAVLKYYPHGRRFYSGGQILNHCHVAEMLVKGIKVKIIEDKTYVDITDRMVKKCIATYIKKREIEPEKIIKIAGIL